MSCTSLDPPSYCSNASPELKLYQAFIFSVPIFFTFILLLLFYVFYLRRRRANWQSLRMRASQLTRGDNPRPSDSGIKKEVREMLPVVVFKESFLIRETQCTGVDKTMFSYNQGQGCSVCLGDYQSDERLQRIPPCGHTFHVDCIDHWLATNTTCPLCRVSLLPAAKSGSNTSNIEGQATQEREVQEQLSGSRTDVRIIQHDNEAEHRERVSGTEDLAHLRREVEEFRHDREACVVIDVEAPGCAQESLRP